MANKQRYIATIEHAPMLGVRVSSRPPPNMTAMRLPPDLHEAMTEIALGIFTDVVNQGRAFQDAILAVYLSGVNHGVEGGGNG